MRPSLLKRPYSLRRSIARGEVLQQFQMGEQVLGNVRCFHVGEVLQHAEERGLVSRVGHPGSIREARNG